MSRRPMFHAAQVREKGRLKSPTSDECGCCGEKATHWIRFSTSVFRGDDDTYLVCERHFSMGVDPAQGGKFFAHLHSKERFVAGKRNEVQS